MRTGLHSATQTHNALVQISASGVTGQGAALTLAAGQALAVLAMVRDLAPLVMGRDPREPRAIWADLRRRLNLTGSVGIGLLALSAIDSALWDLHARAIELPLYRLLGAGATSFPVYAQPGWASLSVEELVEEALGYEAQGFRHYKMRIGAGPWQVARDRVAAVRSALAPDAALLGDANQGWNRIEARQAARALDELGMFWIEEPLAADDVDGMAELASRVRTPLAAGETMFGAEGLQPLLDQRAVAVLMPDLQHCGGPTGFLKAAAAAERAGVPISNHLFLETSVHLLAAFENTLVVEHMPGWWDDLYVEPPQIHDGRIRPRDTPGVGVRFREDFASVFTAV